MTSKPEVHQREEHFHNEWALTTDVDSIQVAQPFEAFLALENQFILREMGDLKGKAILDIGCGFGESSVYFAQKGANVTAIDLSPEMLQLAQKLAKKYNVQIKTQVSSAESLHVPDESFDIVYAANVIHHTTDRKKFFEQVHNALKPTGRFFSFDPLAYNPIIHLYRSIATKVRTPDEQPLRRRDILYAKEYFQRVRHREFWIASLALFLKYYLFNRSDPNQDRYWKKLLKETPQSAGWLRPLIWLDRILTRIPLLRWMAWNTVIILDNPLPCR